MAAIPVPLPPLRTNLNPDQQVRAIHRITKKPTYSSKRRAWTILGFGSTRGRPKPATSLIFINQVSNLWDIVRTVDSKEAEAARAYILDAFATLGYRNQRWHANMQLMSGLIPLGAGVNDGDGTFNTAPGPGAGNAGDQNAQAWHTLSAPKASPSEPQAADSHFTDLWQRYHRYQGFYALDYTIAPNGTVTRQAKYFRAIPVPQGPDSLWHAISYWRGVQMPTITGVRRSRDIWQHWKVKARIWTWFVQSLFDSTSVRFRDYHILQELTKTRSERYAEGTHPNGAHHGELSLLRSLYASRQQGLPAFSAWPGNPSLANQDPDITCDAIFHVIADYFCTQVVVFAYNDKKPRLANAVVPRMDTFQEQGSYEYSYRAYGSILQAPNQVPGFNPQQIFLATNDWMNFDAVDWDYNQLHDKPNFFPTGYAHNQDNLQTPFIVPAKFDVDFSKIQHLPAIWWRPPWIIPPIHPLNPLPPCHQTRYNRMPTGTVVPVDLDEQLQVIGQRAPLRFRELYSLHNNRHHTINFNWERFHAGIDIGGYALTHPSELDIAQWQGLPVPQAPRPGPPTLNITHAASRGWAHPVPPNILFPLVRLTLVTRKYQYRHGTPTYDPDGNIDKDEYNKYVGRLGNMDKFLEDMDIMYT